MVVDVNSVPQLADLLNAKFNPARQEKPATLQPDNKVSDLKIEQIKQPERKTIPYNNQTTPSIPLTPEIMVKESIEKSAGEISSFTVIKEPDNFQINHTPVHVSYDDKKKVWIVTEHITPTVRDWLKIRLGWDAYLQFDKICQLEIQQDVMIPQGERLSMIESQNQFAQAMGCYKENTSTLPSYVSEAQSFMQKRHQGADLYSPREYRDFNKLYEQSSNLYSCSNDDYLSAWRGFEYNLDHSHEVPTFISYILSQPFTGNSISQLSPLSVDIQMLMTGTLSENFYNPLGIYASPIARINNKLNGNTNNNNLSLTLHKGMARALCEVNPNIQASIVRPIHSMATILKTSGIPCTISKGEAQNTNRPYIRSLQPVQFRWFSSEVQLAGEEKEQFGNSLFTLIDPRTNKFYQISDNHPFSQNPFLGGVGRNLIEAFPFFTIDVNDLIKM